MHTPLAMGEANDIEIQKKQLFAQRATAIAAAATAASTAAAASEIQKMRENAERAAVLQAKLKTLELEALLQENERQAARATEEAAFQREQARKDDLQRQFVKDVMWLERSDNERKFEYLAPRIQDAMTAKVSNYLVRLFTSTGNLPPPSFVEAQEKATQAVLNLRGVEAEVAAADTRLRGTIKAAEEAKAKARRAIEEKRSIESELATLNRRANSLGSEIRAFNILIALFAVSFVLVLFAYYKLPIAPNPDTELNNSLVLLSVGCASFVLLFLYLRRHRLVINNREQLRLVSLPPSLKRAEGEAMAAEDEFVALSHHVQNEEMKVRVEMAERQQLAQSNVVSTSHTIQLMRQQFIASEIKRLFEASKENGDIHTLVEEAIESIHSEFPPPCRLVPGELNPQTIATLVGEVEPGAIAMASEALLKNEV